MKMSLASHQGSLRLLLVAVLVMGIFITAFLVYFNSMLPTLWGINKQQVQKEEQVMVQKEEQVTVQKEEQVKVQEPDKPIVLIWFWPEGEIFDLNSCNTLFQINSCILTDNQSLYSEAEAVLIYHKPIKWDLSNLPPLPRPPFQKWAWFHLESPTNTRQIPGLENLFNVTLSYRQDADIPSRSLLTAEKPQEGEEFVLPKKDKLVCWIVSNHNPGTGTTVRENYYNELKKYLTVSVYGQAFGSRLSLEEFFPTIASCKFYLSFENSVHKDYITEKLNGPLAVGTVPVVLGPSRQNYEEFIPSNSFIHVNDFPSAKELADHLLFLDNNTETYLSYFTWRKHFTAKKHTIILQEEFIVPTCLACEYFSKHKEYRTVHNLYQWYFN